MSTTSTRRSRFLATNLGVDDGQELFDGVGKLELLVCEPDGARFDLGHVEDLVDEAEQVMARRGDVGEAFAHALGVVGMHARDGREAMMEFMGVRMSWLMELRKSLLACDACSAAWNASSRAWRDASSAAFCSVTSWMVTMYVGRKRAGVTGDAERGDRSHRSSSPRMTRYSHWR